MAVGDVITRKGRAKAGHPDAVLVSLPCCDGDPDPTTVHRRGKSRQDLEAGAEPDVMKERRTRWLAPHSSLCLLSSPGMMPPPTTGLGPLSYKQSFVKKTPPTDLPTD